MPRARPCRGVQRVGSQSGTLRGRRGRVLAAQARVHQEARGSGLFRPNPGSGKVTEQGRAPQGEEKCRGRKQSNVLRGKARVGVTSFMADKAAGKEAGHLPCLFEPTSSAI